MNGSSLMNTEPERGRNPRRPLLLVLVGLISYAFFLLANLPAALVWQHLASPALPVQLANVRGTLWAGVAGSVTVTVNRKPLVLPELSWRIGPVLQLLQGKLPLTVTLGGPSDELEASGHLTLSRTTVTMDNTTLAMPAQWLVDAVGNPFPGSVTGNIAVQLAQLAISRQGCSSLQGQVSLSDIELHSPFGTFMVGQVLAPLECRNQSLVANVSQSAGDISSEGTFTLDHQGNYRYQGDATTHSSTPSALTQALSMITREHQGRWPLRFSGQLD